MCARALAAGNAMVLKPSDTAPVSSLLIAEILGGTLRPDGLNEVCGDRATGRALVEHPTPARTARQLQGARQSPGVP